MGVETGGCPHTAIREDASINLAAITQHAQQVSGARSDPDRDPGGDNLAATFSPELADLTIYVHRRGAGREDPEEGRARHHPLRSAGHQQDGPGPACRRLACR